MDLAFLARPSTAVAPDLLGCVLVCPGEGTAARIVEVEAYDSTDPAAHTFRGRTPGNAVMWERAGHLYTYFTYGMHWCANVVTGEVGEGQAVLLRAAEPLAGEEVFRARRGDRPSRRDLLRGPARLAQAFGLGRDHDGLDLLAPDAPLRVHRRVGPAPEVVAGPRVGVRRAADVPWRFAVADSPWVSRYVRHPKAPPAS
ncbi:DNA-3-methyladenine glycosylase [Euzebya sp.]|uniref:DNA-3-methyladenine glycosylase n=1 Tax=Euzebya sp. TaxID=1971409 RepID=UPI003517FFAF